MSDNIRSPELLRLEFLVGKWNGEGTTNDGRIVPIHSVNTYEWMPGDFCLLHKMDAQIGEDVYNCVEIMGYDGESQSYVTRFFDGWGGTGAYSVTVAGDTWIFTGVGARATVIVSKDDKTMTQSWQMSEDGTRWHSWMDLTLTKVQ